MNKLLEWLEREIMGIEVFNFICCILIINFFGNVIVWCFIELFLGIDIPSAEGNILILSWDFLILILKAATIEELFFRFIPLVCAIHFFGVSFKVIVVAVIFSVIFGIAHGSYCHIFLQGVGGLVYSIVFLKCGGFQRKYLKAGAVCAVTHASFNLLLALIIFESGGRYF